MSKTRYITKTVICGEYAHLINAENGNLVSIVETHDGEKFTEKMRKEAEKEYQCPIYVKHAETIKKRYRIPWDIFIEHAEEVMSGEREETADE